MAVQIKKEPVSLNGGVGPGSVGQMDVAMSSSSVLMGSNPKAQLASKIKLTLVQAWRERWTEVQWAIQLKRMMSAYSETVDIAEILMQQALIGSSPNSLILLYLKHSVLSLMIPFSSVLRCITKFDDFSRPYCVLALLHLCEMFGSKISLSPSQETPIQLVNSKLSLLHWLVKAPLVCLQKIQDNRSGQVASEYFLIMENASRAICNIAERKVVRSLMQIAMADSAEEYREFEQCQMNARGTLGRLPPSAVSEETREKLNKALSLLSRIQEPEITSEPVLEVLHSPLSPTIHGLVSLEAILNPNSDIQSFVDQLMDVSRLLKHPMPQVCLEIFRACFMGYLNTNESSEDLQWAAFTLLKVPHILNKFKLQERDIMADVESGLNMLMECSRLLDQTDIKFNNDMLGMFITECHKVGVLTEEQKNTLMLKRREQRSHIRMSDPAGSSSGKNLFRLTNAESTVNSILKSLDSDPMKNYESLVKVLNMLSGQSFEILRLSASCTGKLHDFITKLIRINEFASLNNDLTRNPPRYQLFDTTFLMITSIIQQNGIEIVSPSRENETSLIIKWARRWLPEEGRYKNCEITLAEEQEKIDHILSLLLKKAEIMPYEPLNSCKDLIMCFPYALQEILYAVEHKSLSMDEVKNIIDHIRKQNLKCLVLVGVTYLCSYMNISSAASRNYPRQMLELFMATQNSESSTKQPVQIINSIMDNIVYDILPENHAQRPARRYQLSRKELTSKIMDDTLKESFHRGWLNMASLMTLDQILTLRGTDWFCWEVVEHLIQQSHIVDTSQSLALAFAIMHMDLERMTISLLHRVLPRLLTNSQSNHLTDPWGYSLAKLCVLCITATSKIGHKAEPYVRRSRKRSPIEAELDEDLEESDTSPAKLRKLSAPQLTFGLEEFNLDVIAEKEEGETSTTFDPKEPLTKAFVNLFLLMNSILQCPTLTPRTWFIISFIKEAIKCGGQHTRFILQFMPQNMLGQIMRSLPGVFTNEQILRICDLNSASGRSIAAKVICNNAQVTQLEYLD